MSLFKKDADNEYKIYFINNFTIDICKGLDKIAQLPPMMKIAELKEVSNVLHPCPFEVSDQLNQKAKLKNPTNLTLEHLNYGYRAIYL